MRITEKQHHCIREAIEETMPDAEPYLFGSRTDDLARGGDIDILLLSERKLPLRSVMTLKRKILSKIGEQKLDIVNFSKSTNTPFKKLILEKAVKL